jgi:anti-sigma B factor antagonist
LTTRLRAAYAPVISVVSRLDVRFDEMDGALVVVLLTNRLDIENATAFCDATLDRLAGRERVVLALGAVHFMDSSGIACLVRMIKRMPPGGQLRLADVDPRVGVLLKITRLAPIFPAFDSVAAAVKG